MSEFHVTRAAGESTDTTVFQLNGPLLISHVPAFTRGTHEVSSKNVVLDFANVTYMDSAGLGAVIQLYRNLLPGGQRLVLVHLNQRVAALLKLTRADTILEVKADLAAAEKI